MSCYDAGETKIKKETYLNEERCGHVDEGPAERSGVTDEQRATCPLASGRASNLIVVAFVLLHVKVRRRGKRGKKKKTYLNDMQRRRVARIVTTVLSRLV